jgi:hypothetical protein
MVNTLSYQMYRCEHGLSAAEQRAADVRAGEAAAAVRRGRGSRGRSRRRRAFLGRPGGQAAGAVKVPEAASMRLLSSGR